MKYTQLTYIWECAVFVSRVSAAKIILCDLGAVFFFFFNIHAKILRANFGFGA